MRKVAIWIKSLIKYGEAFRFCVRVAAIRSRGYTKHVPTTLW
jgi:hypothetical protein